MGGPSADDPPDKVKSAARSTSSKLDDAAKPRAKQSLLPFFTHSRGTNRTNGTNGTNGTHGSHASHNAVENQTSDATASARPAATPPPGNAQAEGEKHPPLRDTGADEVPPDKKPITLRMKNGSIRFLQHTKDALLSSWINVLLVFVPAGIAVNFLGLSATIVFTMNAIAIVPLAGLLSRATESVADRLGDTWGALLNVSFGNAVELIIFIIGLIKNEIEIVQASILGSILSNLLLILGMAFFLGGLRYQEQIYNSTVTQMSACMLSLAVMSLLLPTAFHASWSDSNSATYATLQVSRGSSVILLIIYVLYLLFQLKSHAFLYESMPQRIIDEESRPGVLHNVLESSTSSSSSDTSSDDDSDSSSASGGTARRAFRRFRRMRRKSSASSKDTPSLPSMVSSPSYEMESHHPVTSRRTSILNPVRSGDEGDEADAETGGIGRTTVRDFEQQPPSSYRRGKKKHKKRHHRKHRTESKAQSDMTEAKPAPASVNMLDGPTPPVDERRVGFAGPIDEGAQQVEDEKRLEASRNRMKNPFNMPTRPAIRKTLSTAIPTVFQTPSPVIQGISAPAPQPTKTSQGIRVPMGPRRVRSLPDKMNRPVLSAPPSRGDPAPLPPASMHSHLESHDDEHEGAAMSRTAAVVLLLISTGLVALCAEFMVDAIPAMTANASVSQAFIGLVILPIVGNAAEHVTAVTVAVKNKMDLAIGVAVGSSIQIALFVCPLIVLLGWIMQRDMSLYFNLFETVSLFVTAFVVNFLVLDGRSNYLEGALLMGAYLIIAVAAFFYPDTNDQSELGGNGTSERRAVAASMVTAVFTG